jgi:hypothetical protein
MTTSSYDPCLLIITKKEAFRVVGIQTNDTLFLASDEFTALKDSELQKAQLTAKPRDKLSVKSSLMFNRCAVTIEPNNTIHLTQKDQEKKIQPVNKKEDDPQQEYLKQRAYGAYIAFICQPEALFDLSVTAQHQNLTTADICTLNKRLK